MCSRSEHTTGFSPVGDAIKFYSNFDFQTVMTFMRIKNAIKIKGDLGVQVNFDVEISYFTRQRR